MVFIIFFLVNEKNQLQVLAVSFEITLKILPETRYKDSKAVILTRKLHTGRRLRFCKIIQEATMK
jgi:hypothetical protein